MDRDLKGLKKIIGANNTGTGWIRWDEEVDLLAKQIYDAGYRNITDLKAWLKEEIERIEDVFRDFKSEGLEGRQRGYKIILNKLRKEEI